MKAAQDSYTITIKQIVKFQERMACTLTIGHYLPRQARYPVNCGRYLDHITIKQNVRFHERMHRSNSKWPPIDHYLLSHGRYIGKPC